MRTATNCSWWCWEETWTKGKKQNHKSESFICQERGGISWIWTKQFQQEQQSGWKTSFFILSTQLNSSISYGNLGLKSWLAPHLCCEVLHGHELGAVAKQVAQGILLQPTKQTVNVCNTEKVKKQLSGCCCSRRCQEFDLWNVSLLLEMQSHSALQVITASTAPQISGHSSHVQRFALRNSRKNPKAWLL